ncbi:MAG TPA: hypothetical protein PLY87_02715 [Planctomycetaceae bacterium]|nr:hypothetical protein [Planctomycetaceae bacterium]
MEYLKAPTDNLYKFIAIAGAALIAVCVIQTTGQLAEISQQSFQLSKDIAIQKVENERLNERSKAFRKELAVEIQNPEKLTPEGKPLLFDKVSDIQRKNEELEDFHFETMKSSAVLAVQIERLGQLTSAYATWVHRALIAVGIGVIMMILGFRLWYSRVQVFQDRLLQKQTSEQAPKSLSKEPNAKRELPWLPSVRIPPSARGFNHLKNRPPG